MCYCLSGTINSRSSLRKKWRTQIEEKFPQLTAMDVAELIPNKDVNVTKIFTHNGDVVHILSVQKNPLLFEVEGVFYPTVYMLWRFPDLVPTYTTWSDVVPKLCRGADLMLPGIILPDGNSFGPKSFGNLQKGDICAVNLITNKACIAVGITALSSEDMFVSGKRGKGVTILHTYSDHLWSLGDKSPPPNLPPPFERNVISSDFIDSTASVKSELDDKGTVAESSNMDSTNATVLQKLEVLSIDSTDNTVSYVSEEERKTLSATNDENDISAVSQEEEKDNTEQENDNQELTPEDKICDPNVLRTVQFESADSLLIYCFLKAWKTCAKKVELPLLTSKFYKVYLLASIPSGCNLDIKKTSYKKFGKFLAAMQEKGLIKVKELSKGVESIVEVNLLHPDLKDFSIKKEDTVAHNSSQVESLAKHEPPQIDELYFVNATVLPLFTIFKYE